VDILQLAMTSKLRSDFGESIRNIHLVEQSLVLRTQQQQALETALGHVIDFEFVGKENDTTSKNHATDDDANANTPKHKIRVEWHIDFASFQHKRDKDMPVMMILQEFLDALPVHVFQKTEEGWRELLIDVASAREQPNKPTDGDESSLRPRLRQVLAPTVTPAVELFFESSIHQQQYGLVPEGTVVEICPEALLLIQDMIQVLEESQGAALMIDYGQDGTGDSLRAFSKHAQVPLTSYPGEVDVTANVDFYALRQQAKETSQTIHAFGPVTQGNFLMRMGAGEMVINSIEQPETTEEQAEKLSDALKYLILPEHMGEKFKVLCLSKKRDGIFAPPGMER
jgi:NADH dehydrogenase [ubiquinone] 1 alpha subcomplex assembly factor 7